MSFGSMIAGDSMTKPVTITNTGALGFTYTLTTSCTAGCAGPLWTNAGNGLQLTVKRGGATIYAGPIQVTNLAMGVIVAPAQVDSTSLMVNLPATAGNAFTNQSSTVVFTWTATQFP
jgi:hypothetical protein